MSEKKRTAQDYSDDILKTIDDARSFIERMTFEDFKIDEKTQYAVVRALEVIGEAANNIPAHIREKHPNIPWRNILEMRNSFIHEQFGINLDTVWEILQKELPLIENYIKEIEE